MKSLLLPLLLATLSAPVLAESTTRSLRCGSDIVSVGEGRAAVLSKCGEPLVRDSFCKPPPSTTPPTPPAPACEMVDEWTYKPERGQFMTTMRFEGGKLTRITYGDRVQ